MYPDLEAIFHAAREKSGAQRTAYLEQACGEDNSLRERVEALLRADRDAGSFLDKTPSEIDALDHETGLFRPQALPDLGFLEPAANPESLGQLGPYDVQAVIGWGGMGIVMRAFDPRLSRVVAIKVLAPEWSSNPVARGRFLREARAAAAVTHDHLVRIYAVEESAALPYIVMECIEGKSLEQKIEREGALQLKEILRIGRQIASGLAAAHQQGLVHRDIKPANVLLENGIERAKITDFGLARAIDDTEITQAGQIAGTPAYMSPEQARGERVDHRSDLFSLGSVIYEMCTGLPAFRAGSTVAVLKKIVDESPPPIHNYTPETPAWLCGTVDKLHAQRPEDRFQSAAELADELGDQLALIQRGETVTPKVERTESSRKHAAWPRWSALAAILVLLLAGLGATDATGLTAIVPSVIRVFRGEGTIVIEVADPGVSVSIGDDEQLVITGAGANEIRLSPGQYSVEATKEGETVHQQLVSVEKNGRRVVRIGFEPAKHDGAKQAEAGNAQTSPVAWHSPMPGLLPVALELKDGRRAQFVSAAPMGPLREIAASTDCSRVAITEPGWIRILDGETLKTRTVLPGCEGASQGLAWHPSDEFLTVRGTDGQIRFVNLRGEIEKQILGEVGDGCLAWSPDGKTLAATLASSKSVQFYGRNGLRGRKLVLPDSSYVPGPLVWHPQGEWLAVAESRGFLVHLVIPEGQLRKSIDVGTTDITDLCISPDGNRLAVATTRKIVVIEPLADEQNGVRRLIETPTSAIAWSATADIIATGSNDDTIQFWNPETGANAGSTSPHPGRKERLVFCGDSLLSTSFDRHSVQSWSIDGTPKASLVGEQREYVSGVLADKLVLFSARSEEFQPDAGWTAFVDGEFSSYTLQGRRNSLAGVPGFPPFVYSTHHYAWPARALLPVALAPGGIAAYGGRGEIYQIEELQPLQVNTENILSTGGGQKSQFSWNSRGDRLAIAGERFLMYKRTGDTFTEYKTELGNPIVAHVAWNASGTLLAVATEDPTIYILDADGKQVSKITRETDWVRAAAWHGDQLLAIALRERIEIINVDGTVTQQLPSPNGDISKLAFNDHGDLAAAAVSGVVRIYDLQSSKSKTLVGHQASISVLHWAADDKQLVTASRDGSWRLWDVAQRRPLHIVMTSTHGDTLFIPKSGRISTDQQVLAGELLQVLVQGPGQEALVVDFTADLN